MLTAAAQRFAEALRLSDDAFEIPATRGGDFDHRGELTGRQRSREPGFFCAIDRRTGSALASDETWGAGLSFAGASAFTRHGDLLM